MKRTVKPLLDHSKERNKRMKTKVVSIKEDDDVSRLLERGPYETKMPLNLNGVDRKWISFSIGRSIR